MPAAPEARYAIFMLQQAVEAGSGWLFRMAIQSSRSTRGEPAAASGGTDAGKFGSRPCLPEKFL
jgi:hypothetical protein